MCLIPSYFSQLEKLAELLQKESKIRDGAETFLQVPHQVSIIEVLVRIYHGLNHYHL